MTDIFKDTDPSKFLGASRHIDLTGLVEYQDSHGLMITHVGAFSLWENGGVVINHSTRAEDVLPNQVKQLSGTGTHDYKKVKVTWIPENKNFTVKGEN